MWDIVLTIVVVGLALIAWFFVWDGFFHKPKSIEPSHIEQVREAAFAVIEASLEAEPEKWTPTMDGSRVEWLVNEDASVGIWLRTGPGNLFIFNRADPAKLEPTQVMATRLYTAAMKIVRGTAEKIETRDLQKMVAAFGQIVDRRKNDQEAA